MFDFAGWSYARTKGLVIHLSLQKAEKGGGGGGGGDEGPNMDQLKLRIAELEREREEEAKQRSYMQHERDEINKYWEVRGCMIVIAVRRNRVMHGVASQCTKCKNRSILRRAGDKEGAGRP